MWMGFRRKKSILIVIILFLFIILIKIISKFKAEHKTSNVYKVHSGKDFVDFPIYSENEIVPIMGDSVTVTETDNQRKGRVRLFSEIPKIQNNEDIQCVPLRTHRGHTPICIFNPDEDRMISSYVKDYGTWEPDYVNATTEVLLSDSDMHFIDIGCNIGVYTLHAASLGKQVIAVDPLRKSLQLLSKSLTLGGLRDNVTLLLNAISDVPGPVRLQIVSKNIGGSYIESNNNDDQAPGTVVQSILMDDLLSYINFKKAFVKMDIEGSEFKALMGATSFFHTVDVRYILMEWMLQRQTKQGQLLVDMLIKNGFLPYRDAKKIEFLKPADFADWPDNIFWIKR